jgi:hypothetical protein
MLWRNPAQGPPLDENGLEDRLAGVPTTPPTNTTTTQANNLFATTEEDTRPKDKPFSTSLFASWQSEDPQMQVIIKNMQSDTPARSTRNSKTSTDQHVVSHGLLRINVGDHSPVVIPSAKSQQFIWRYHDQPPGLERNVPGRPATFLLEET